MVGKAKDYIKAGDVFQVVLDQQFSTLFPLPPFSFYRSLRRINPSPYLFFLNFEGFSIVGSSPEVLVGGKGYGQYPSDRWHPTARQLGGGGQNHRCRVALRRKGTGRTFDAA